MKISCPITNKNTRLTPFVFSAERSHCFPEWFLVLNLQRSVCAGAVVHLGHAGHASHEQDLVDLALTHAGILHAVLAGLQGALQEGACQCLELAAGDGHAQVLGACKHQGDVKMC